MQRLLLTSLVLLLSGCATTPISRYHFIDEGSDFSSTVTGRFYWQKQGPLDLIAELKSGVLERERKKYRWTDFRIDGVHYGWVQASDIPALIALLDSREPCLPVVMTISSRLGTELSTVGHEAAFLIEAFRRGRYPVKISSTDWVLSKEEQYDFDQWCKRFLSAYKRNA